MTCGVCDEEVSDLFSCNKCVYKICKECISNWYAKHDTCPNCREINTYDIKVEKDSDTDDADARAARIIFDAIQMLNNVTENGTGTHMLISIGGRTFAFEYDMNMTNIN